MLNSTLTTLTGWKRVGLELLGKKTRSAALFCWLIAILLLVLTSACSLQGKQPGRNEAILFSDDFSNTSGGWGTWRKDGAVVEHHNGGLRILVNETQFDFWSVAGQHFVDSQIEVDAIKIGGPDDNDFGIICRYQDKANFYMLIVSSDGYYGVAKLKDGQYSMIGADQLQYSDAIARGQGLNRLRADCIGQTLTMYANDQKLVEVQDSDFIDGDVGLLAGAYDLKGVDLLFDNFVVKKPD